ncbi:MAG: hypothetical protein ACE5FF_11920 [Saprospiraceae bacterium]
MNGIISQTTDYRRLLIPLLLLFSFPFFTLSPALANTPAGDDVIIICPNDLTVEAAPGLCGVVFDFNTLEWFSTVPLADTLFTPGPGSFFFIGTTPVTLMGTDTFGIVSVCSFNLTITEYTGMSCHDTVVVNLDEDCSVPLNYETLLILNEYGCPITGFDINLLSPTGDSLGDVITPAFLGHLWEFTVTNSSGTSCAGHVLVPAAGQLSPAPLM